MYIIYLLKHLKENYKKVTAVVNNVEAIWNLTLLLIMTTRLGELLPGVDYNNSWVLWRGRGQVCSGQSSIGQSVVFSQVHVRRLPDFVSCSTCLHTLGSGGV